MKAVILVGGEGTRLKPLTCNTPKPLLPLVNKPLIRHVISHLKAYGISEIILSSGYLSEAFFSELGSGEELEANITYVVETEPLGTCGAVKNAQDYLDSTFLVLNGDILTTLNLTDLIASHRRKSAMVTIALTSAEDPTAYGVVELDKSSRVTRFVEKPSRDQVTSNLINAGTYVVESEALREAPDKRNYSFERQLFPSLLENGGGVFGFLSDAYWIDIGTPGKYLLAHHDALSGKAGLSLAGQEIKKDVWVGGGTMLHPKAIVGGPTLIGEKCYVGPHAYISGRSVVGDGCSIQSGVVVEKSIVGANTNIGRGSVVRGSVVGSRVTAGRDTLIEENSVISDSSCVKDGSYLERGSKVWPPGALD